MSVNPLFTDAFYFFSDMFDDTLLTKFFNRIAKETYDVSVKDQRYATGRHIGLKNRTVFYSVKFSDFKVNPVYNNKTKLPPMSLTARIPGLTMPIGDMKLFLRQYGGNYPIIKLDDFYTRYNIFEKVPMINVDDYRVMVAWFVINRDRSVTLVLPFDKDNEYSMDKYGVENMCNLKALLTDDSEFLISFMDHEKVLKYTDNEIANAVPGTDTYSLILQNDKKLNNLADKPDASNSWDFIAYDGSRSNLYRVCSCNEEYTSIGTKFDIPTRSFQILRPVLERGPDAQYGYFMKRQNRRSLMYFAIDPHILPIFNLEYAYNPSSDATLEIYHFNSSNFIKGRRLNNENHFQKYFPNIYDFSEMVEEEELTGEVLIEIFEYYPSHTNSTMRNSLKPLVQSLGNYYTEFVNNGYDVGAGIQSYKPTMPNIYYPDYWKSTNEHSEYWGNHRGYLLNKLMDIMKSDPYVLNKYYQYLAELNPKVITKSGTPKTFKFNTGLSGEFSGSNPIVMDTSSITEDTVITFDVPHSYISYRANDKRVPSMVYINGRFTIPTAHVFENGINYLFFPVDTIKNAVLQYETASDMINSQPIIIDVFPDTYTSIGEATTVDFICTDEPFNPYVRPDPNNTCLLEIDNGFLLEANYGQIVDTETSQTSGYVSPEPPVFSLNDITLVNGETGQKVKNWQDLLDITVHVTRYIIADQSIHAVLIKDDEAYSCILVNEQNKKVIGEPYEGEPLPFMLEIDRSGKFVVGEPYVGEIEQFFLELGEEEHYDQFYLMYGEDPSEAITQIYGLYPGCTIIRMEDDYLSLKDQFDSMVNVGLLTPDQIDLLEYKKLDMRNVMFSMRKGNWLLANDDGRLVATETDVPGERAVLDIGPNRFNFRLRPNNIMMTKTFTTDDLNYNVDHYEGLITAMNIDDPKDHGAGHYDQPYDVGSNGRYMLYHNGLATVKFRLVPQDNDDCGDFIIQIYDDVVAGDTFDLVHLPINVNVNEIAVNAGLRYMKPAKQSGTSPDTIWPDGYTVVTDGIMFTDRNDTDKSGCYIPLEMDQNLKFTSTGHRLPATKNKTNTETKAYYSPEQCILLKDMQVDYGFVIRPSCGLTIEAGTDLKSINVLERLFA